MGEVVHLISRHERERIHLIREARAIYESVFPSATPVSRGSDETTPGQAARSTGAHAGSGVAS